MIRKIEQVLSSPLVFDENDETDERVLARCRSQLRYWDKIKSLMLDHPEMPLSEIHDRAAWEISEQI